MKKLTKAEKAWLDKLQKVLDDCPSDRMVAYTIGDDRVVVFDSDVYKQYVESQPEDSQREVCQEVQRADCKLACLEFPFQVWSTAG